jgi:hypothetical protein
VLHRTLGEIWVEKKQRFEDTAEKKVNLGINGRRAPGIELKSWGVEL